MRFGGGFIVNPREHGNDLLPQTFTDGPLRLGGRRLSGEIGGKELGAVIGEEDAVVLEELPTAAIKRVENVGRLVEQWGQPSKEHKIASVRVDDERCAPRAHPELAELFAAADGVNNQQLDLVGDDFDWQ